jgi:predicted nucleic acid-binding protein
LSQPKIHAEATAKLFVQNLIKDSAVELCYSLMSIAEILDCNIEYNKAQILDFINEVNADYVGYEAATVASLAYEALQTGIKDKDANHTACAIIGKCDYFLTTDKRLLKYKTDKLRLVNPIEFVKIWEEHNGV